VDGALAPSAEHCVDWAGGMSAGGLAAFRSSASAANVARMIAGFAVPADAASDLVADRDYFAFNARISNANSTGELACGGCTTPTCIVFTLLRIATPPGPKGVPSRDVSIAAPADGTHDHIVTWQGVQRAGDSTRALCPAIVAARDSSAGPGAHR
jgi:hypothetical protein